MTGIVKEINPVILSHDQTVNEQGELIIRFWKDNVINGILRRVEK